MNMMDSRPGTLPVDSSLISPEFIQLLQEQRVLHKREAAFYQAEAEKHGAADEALASMIEAAEKVVAILYPGEGKAAEAPGESPAEDTSSGPDWTETVMTAVPKAAEPLSYTEPPATHGLEALMSDDHAGKSGNMWRARLLGSRT